MLERFVAPLLTRLLGDYVKDDCFSPEKVQVGVWSGYVVLNNLELKEEILDELQLPFGLVRGYIGRVELQIPWGNPGSKPTVIKVDQVYLLVETKYEWVGSRATARQEKLLEKKLEQVKRRMKAAVRPQGSHSSGEDQQETTADEDSSVSQATASPGFIERLLTKVVDNLQIHLRGLHIRVEDRVTMPSKPFSFGLCLESLHVQTTDSNFHPSFVDATSETLRTSIVYKLVHLNHFAVYWNPHLVVASREGPIPAMTSDISTINCTQVSKPPRVQSNLVSARKPELSYDFLEAWATGQGGSSGMPACRIEGASTAVTDNGASSSLVESVPTWMLLRRREEVLASRRTASAHASFTNKADESRADARNYSGGRTDKPKRSKPSVYSGTGSDDAATSTSLSSWKFGRSADPFGYGLGGINFSKELHDEGVSSSPKKEEENALSMMEEDDRRSTSFSEDDADDSFGGMVDFSTCHLELFASLFQSMIPTRASTFHEEVVSRKNMKFKQHYVLEPLDAQLRLRLNKDQRDTSKPQHSVDLKVGGISSVIGRDQLQQMAQLGTSVATVQLRESYVDFRPIWPLQTGPVALLSERERFAREILCRRWWLYAFRACQTRLRQGSPWFSSLNLRRRRLLKRCYIWLYKRAIATSILAPERAGSKHLQKSKGNNEPESSGTFYPETEIISEHPLEKDISDRKSVYSEGKTAEDYMGTNNPFSSGSVGTEDMKANLDALEDTMREESPASSDHGDSGINPFSESAVFRRLRLPRKEDNRRRLFNRRIGGPAGDDDGHEVDCYSTIRNYFGIWNPIESYKTPEDILECRDVFNMSIMTVLPSMLETDVEEDDEQAQPVNFQERKEALLPWLRWAKEFKRSSGAQTSVAEIKEKCKQCTFRALVETKSRSTTTDNTFRMSALDAMSESEDIQELKPLSQLERSVLQRLELYFAENDIALLRQETLCRFRNQCLLRRRRKYRKDTPSSKLRIRELRSHSPFPGSNEKDAVSSHSGRVTSHFAERPQEKRYAEDARSKQRKGGKMPEADNQVDDRTSVSGSWFSLPFDIPWSHSFKWILGLNSSATTVAENVGWGRERKTGGSERDSSASWISSHVCREEIAEFEKLLKASVGKPAARGTHGSHDEQPSSYNNFKEEDNPEEIATKNSSVHSSGNHDSGESDDDDNDSIVLRAAMLGEARRREVYSAIGYDPTLPEQHYPPNYSVSKIGCNVEYVSMKLCTFVHDSTQTEELLLHRTMTEKEAHSNEEIVQVEIKELNISMTIRSSSFCFLLDVMDLVISDKACTRNSRFEHIFRRADSACTMTPFITFALQNQNLTQPQPAHDVRNLGGPPAQQLPTMPSCEHHDGLSEANVLLSVRILPLELVYSTSVTQRLKELLDVPLNELPETVEASVAQKYLDMRERMQSKFERAYSSRWAMSVSASIDRVNFVVPTENSARDLSNTVCVCIDDIRVNTTKLARKNDMHRVDEVNTLQDKRVDNDIFNNLEASSDAFPKFKHLYDELSVALNSITIVVQQFNAMDAEPSARMEVIRVAGADAVVSLNVLPSSRMLPALAVELSMQPAEGFIDSGCFHIVVDMCNSIQQENFFWDHVARKRYDKEIGPERSSPLSEETVENTNLEKFESPRGRARSKDIACGLSSYTGGDLGMDRLSSFYSAQQSPSGPRHHHSKTLGSLLSLTVSENSDERSRTKLMSLIPRNQPPVVDSEGHASKETSFKSETCDVAQVHLKISVTDVTVHLAYSNDWHSKVLTDWCNDREFALLEGSDLHFSRIEDDRGSLTRVSMGQLNAWDCLAGCDDEGNPLIATHLSNSEPVVAVSSASPRIISSDTRILSSDASLEDITVDSSNCVAEYHAIKTSPFDLYLDDDIVSLLWEQFAMSPHPADPKSLFGSQTCISPGESVTSNQGCSVVALSSKNVTLYFQKHQKPLFRTEIDDINFESRSVPVGCVRHKEGSIKLQYSTFVEGKFTGIKLYDLHTLRNDAIAYGNPCLGRLILCIDQDQSSVKFSSLTAPILEGNSTVVSSLNDLRHLYCIPSGTMFSESTGESKHLENLSCLVKVDINGINCVVEMPFLLQMGSDLMKSPLSEIFAGPVEETPGSEILTRYSVNVSDQTILLPRIDNEPQLRNYQINGGVWNEDWMYPCKDVLVAEIKKLNVVNRLSLGPKRIFMENVGFSLNALSISQFLSIDGNSLLSFNALCENNWSKYRLVRDTSFSIGTRFSWGAKADNNVDVNVEAKTIILRIHQPQLLLLTRVIYGNFGNVLKLAATPDEKNSSFMSFRVEIQEFQSVVLDGNTSHDCRQKLASLKFSGIRCFFASRFTELHGFFGDSDSEFDLAVRDAEIVDARPNVVDDYRSLLKKTNQSSNSNLLELKLAKGSVAQQLDLLNLSSANRHTNEEQRNRVDLDTVRVGATTCRRITGCLDSCMIFLIPELLMRLSDTVDLITNGLVNEADSSGTSSEDLGKTPVLSASVTPLDLVVVHFTLRDSEVRFTSSKEEVQRLVGVLSFGTAVTGYMRPMPPYQIWSLLSASVSLSRLCLDLREFITLGDKVEVHNNLPILAVANLSFRASRDVAVAHSSTRSVSSYVSNGYQHQQLASLWKSGSGASPMGKATIKEIILPPTPRYKLDIYIRKGHAAVSETCLDSLQRLCCAIAGELKPNRQGADAAGKADLIVEMNSDEFDFYAHRLRSQPFCTPEKGLSECLMYQPFLKLRICHSTALAVVDRAFWVCQIDVSPSLFVHSGITNHYEEIFNLKKLSTFMSMQHEANCRSDTAHVLQQYDTWKLLVGDESCRTRGNENAVFEAQVDLSSVFVKLSAMDILESQKQLQKYLLNSTPTRKGLCSLARLRNKMSVDVQARVLGNKNVLSWQEYPSIDCTVNGLVDLPLFTTERNRYQSDITCINEVYVNIRLRDSVGYFREAIFPLKPDMNAVVSTKDEEFDLLVVTSLGIDHSIDVTICNPIQISGLVGKALGLEMIAMVGKERILDLTDFPALPKSYMKISPNCQSSVFPKCLLIRLKLKCNSSDIPNCEIGTVDFSPLGSVDPHLVSRHRTSVIGVTCAVMEGLRMNFVCSLGPTNYNCKKKRRDLREPVQLGCDDGEYSPKSVARDSIVTIETDKTQSASGMVKDLNSSLTITISAPLTFRNELSVPVTLYFSHPDKLDQSNDVHVLELGNYDSSYFRVSDSPFSARLRPGQRLSWYGCEWYGKSFFKVCLNGFAAEKWISVGYPEQQLQYAKDQTLNLGCLFGSQRGRVHKESQLGCFSSCRHPCDMYCVPIMLRSRRHETGQLVIDISSPFQVMNNTCIPFSFAMAKSRQLASSLLENNEGSSILEQKFFANDIHSLLPELEEKQQSSSELRRRNRESILSNASNTLHPRKLTLGNILGEKNGILDAVDASVATTTGLLNHSSHNVSSIELQRLLNQFIRTPSYNFVFGFENVTRGLFLTDDVSLLSSAPQISTTAGAFTQFGNLFCKPRTGASIKEVSISSFYQLKAEGNICAPADVWREDVALDMMSSVDCTDIFQQHSRHCHSVQVPISLQLSRCVPDKTPVISCAYGMQIKNCTNVPLEFSQSGNTVHRRWVLAPGTQAPLVQLESEQSDLHVPLTMIEKMMSDISGDSPKQYKVRMRVAQHYRYDRQHLEWEWSGAFNPKEFTDGTSLTLKCRHRPPLFTDIFSPAKSVIREARRKLLQHTVTPAFASTETVCFQVTGYMSKLGGTTIQISPYSWTKNYCNVSTFRKLKEASEKSGSQSSTLQQPQEYFIMTDTHTNLSNSLFQSFPITQNFPIAICNETPVLICICQQGLSLHEDGELVMPSQKVQYTWNDYNRGDRLALKIFAVSMSHKHNRLDGGLGVVEFGRDGLAEIHRWPSIAYKDLSNRKDIRLIDLGTFTLDSCYDQTVRIPELSQVMAVGVNLAEDGTVAVQIEERFHAGTIQTAERGLSRLSSLKSLHRAESVISDNSVSRDITVPVSSNVTSSMDMRLSVYITGLHFEFTLNKDCVNCYVDSEHIQLSIRAHENQVKELELSTSRLRVLDSTGSVALALGGDQSIDRARVSFIPSISYNGLGNFTMNCKYMKLRINGQWLSLMLSCLYWLEYRLFSFDDKVARHNSDIKFSEEGAPDLCTIAKCGREAHSDFDILLSPSKNTIYFLSLLAIALLPKAARPSVFPFIVERGKWRKVVKGPLRLPLIRCASPRGYVVEQQFWVCRSLVERLFSSLVVSDNDRKPFVLLEKMNCCVGNITFSLECVEALTLFANTSATARALWLLNDAENIEIRSKAITYSSLIVPFSPGSQQLLNIFSGLVNLRLVLNVALQYTLSCSSESSAIICRSLRAIWYSMFSSRRAVVTKSLSSSCQDLLGGLLLMPLIPLSFVEHMDVAIRRKRCSHQLESFDACQNPVEGFCQSLIAIPKILGTNGMTVGSIAYAIYSMVSRFPLGSIYWLHRIYFSALPARIISYGGFHHMGMNRISRNRQYALAEMVRQQNICCFSTRVPIVERAVLAVALSSVNPPPGKFFRVEGSWALWDTGFVFCITSEHAMLLQFLHAGYFQAGNSRIGRASMVWKVPHHRLRKLEIAGDSLILQALTFTGLGTRRYEIPCGTCTQATSILHTMIQYSTIVQLQRQGKIFYSL